MMIRFLKSRGARKFRRNRMAMAALAIIALYALLALWIIGVETLDYIGERTGTLRPGDHPVIGFLHASSAQQRVGPPLQAGFFRAQAAPRRVEQAEFYLNRARQAVREAQSIAPIGDRTPADILAQARIAERTLAPLPIHDIEETIAAAEAQLTVMDDIRRKSGSLNTVLIDIQGLRRYDRGVGDAIDRLHRFDPETSPEEFRKAVVRVNQAREDLAFKLEDIAFGVEDYIEREHHHTPLHDLDLDALFDAADELQTPIVPSAENPQIGDGEAAAAPFYDHPLIQDIRNKTTAVLGTLEPRVVTQIERVEELVGQLFPSPTGFDRVLYDARTLLGTDRQGRSIFIRAVYSGKTAIQVGFVVAILAVTFGSILGAAAAFYGKWLDHATIYLVSVFTAIPDLVLLVVLAFMFQAGDWSLPWDRDAKIANTLIPLYAAFAMTYWISACRVIRGEALKTKELEYVQAARAVGFSRRHILLRHLLPNTTHLIFISFSLLFVAAIKGEVVLTFLGLGLKGGASWGLMIDDSQTEVVNGFFWQIGAATFFMLVLVLAFNIVSDALQDAFDPRHV